jgi:hypothetical protein
MVDTKFGSKERRAMSAETPGETTAIVEWTGRVAEALMTSQ